MTTPAKTAKCHYCLKLDPSEAVGRFLLYGLSQWAKMPLFAFRLCQECFDRLKGNVEIEVVAEQKASQIEVVQ